MAKNQQDAVLSDYLTKAEKQAAREQMKKAVRDQLGDAIRKAADRVAIAEVKKMLPEINKEVKKQLKAQLHDRVDDLAYELLQDIRVVVD